MRLWVQRFLTQKQLADALEQFYDAAEYQGNDLIQSPTFPELHLTAAQILAGKR
ncbi:hypothetical protein [Thermoleptolyngbya sp. M55_K2018_002]|uniref:hypothetical protein n=1 Tax=Thermoleptolyngbya sp. M55_K2018_002 TaxID=2747808 RepID=UPI0025D7BBE9|nr:hypothetical protein [Thermoleptolyngbya sp. M55_K2018_002]